MKSFFGIKKKSTSRDGLVSSPLKSTKTPLEVKTINPLLNSNVNLSSGTRSLRIKTTAICSHSMPFFPSEMIPPDFPHRCSTDSALPPINSVAASSRTGLSQPPSNPSVFRPALPIDKRSSCPFSLNLLPDPSISSSANPSSSGSTDPSSPSSTNSSSSSLNPSLSLNIAASSNALPSPRSSNPRHRRRHSCVGALSSFHEQFLIDRGDNIQSQLLLYPPGSGSPVSHVRIRGGTPLALVVCLVEMKVYDHLYVDIFLATYRNFMSPLEFFDFLISRFNFKPSAVASSRQIKIDARWSTQVKNRILSVLERWVSLYAFDDLEASRHQVLRKLISFLREISKLNEQKFDIHHRTIELLELCVRLSHEGASADRFHVIIRPNHLSLSTVAQFLEEHFPDLQVSLVKIANQLVELRQCGTWEASEWFSKLIEAEYLVPSKEQRSQYSIHSLMKVNPKTSLYSKLFEASPQSFAEVLTIMDRYLCSLVRMTEFTNCAWTKENSPILSPNIVTNVQFSTILTYRLGLAILCAEDHEKRKTMIIHILKICKHLRASNNFNSLMTLFNVLTLGPISRLKSIWSSLPEKILQRYSELESLLSPLRNYSTLREATQKAESHATISFFGLYLRDIQTADLGNSTHLDDKCLIINFQKFLLIGRSLLKLQSQIPSDARVQLDPGAIQLLSLLFSDSTSLLPSDEDFYDMSREIEPVTESQRKSMGSSDETQSASPRQRTMSVSFPGSSTSPRSSSPRSSSPSPRSVSTETSPDPSQAGASSAPGPGAMIPTIVALKSTSRARSMSTSTDVRPARHRKSGSISLHKNQSVDADRTAKSHRHSNKKARSSSGDRSGSRDLLQTAAVPEVKHVSPQSDASPRSTPARSSHRDVSSPKKKNEKRASTSIISFIISEKVEQNVTFAPDPMFI